MIFKKNRWIQKQFLNIVYNKKKGEYILCEYSMSTIWTFSDIENKHDVYRSEETIKIICESLREYIMKIINFEKKEMILLTNKE